MRFIIAIVAACVFVTLFARSIKAVPWFWYGIALLFDFVYLYGIVNNLPPVFLEVLSVLVQRGTFATALFAIVMYIGVFPEQSWVHKTLGGIRGELSIIAGILILAHCLNYLSSYLGVLMRHIGAINGNQLASLAIAILLLFLVLLLCVTSFKAVKNRMKYSTWKNIQRSSYVFFALIYGHQLLILYPSALKGSGDAFLTCVASGIVFLAYFIVRFTVYLREGKKKEIQVETR